MTTFFTNTNMCSGIYGDKKFDRVYTHKKFGSRIVAERQSSQSQDAMDIDSSITPPPPPVTQTNSAQGILFRPYAIESDVVNKRRIDDSENNYNLSQINKKFKSLPRTLSNTQNHLYQEQQFQQQQSQADVVPCFQLNPQLCALMLQKQQQALAMRQQILQMQTPGAYQLNAGLLSTGATAYPAQHIAYMQ